ncbi:hypothetical protein LguiA_003973 [Lonicera macranthoides]
MEVETPSLFDSFLWLVKLDRILHNKMCLRRGILSNPNCKFCGTEESANHIFLVCTRARKVWRLVSDNVSHDLGDTNFFIWLDTNLNSKKKDGWYCGVVHAFCLHDLAHLENEKEL